ncbi:MAG TPA: HAD-IC family P-type ATPase, partial [Verrucomicrobiae bacterium]|nr:HAD-IC family P-type ATPase [Verrucomicrobiae bacterium]
PAPSGRALGTEVEILCDGRPQGRIVFGDAVRPEAAAAVAALRRLGVRAVLLTGDAPLPARIAAAAADLAEVEASCRPDRKLERVRTDHSGAIAMAGDGINDGPALAAADLGIATGNASDLARCSGNVLLPDGDLRKIPWLISLGRATRSAVRQNFAFAFAYNGIAVAAAAAGLLTPVLAAAAMALSGATLAANSLRLSRFPAPERE